MEQEEQVPAPVTGSGCCSDTLAQRRLAVALGLAIGDSLGATSEFQIPWFLSPPHSLPRLTIYIS
jgi:hypothetical protein